MSDNRDLLMSNLNFDEADLSANQAGRMSDHQSAHYNGLFQRLRLFMGVVAVVCLLVAVYGTYDYFSDPIRSTSSPPIILMLFGYAFFLPTFYYWQRYHRLLKKLENPDLVRSVTGTVSYESPALQGCLNFVVAILGLLTLTSVTTTEDEYITISGVSFLVKPGMKEAFKSGKKYTVYYIEGLRDKPLFVLSAENHE